MDRDPKQMTDSLCVQPPNLPSASCGGGRETGEVSLHECRAAPRYGGLHSTNTLTQTHTHTGTNWWIRWTSPECSDRNRSCGLLLLSRHSFDVQTLEDGSK
ncbi:MAG: hypothetical protein IPG21_18790 [Saprospiraceae bacterium]|nr:hypothetical protein [Candidatus Vicinibacter affinis]